MRRMGIDLLRNANKKATLTRRFVNILTVPGED
jgi:hypothetical protein